ncbi:MAG: MFS transporter, partial [Planctomycetota bacterium]
DAASVFDRSTFAPVDALRTPAFWIPAISLGHFGMFSTGMTFHITSIGAKVDLSKTEAASVFWPMAVFSTASHFISGRLSETVRVRSLLMALVLGVSIATVALLRFDAWWGRGMISLGLGLAAGLFTLLMTVLWPRFFGRAHLGAISGANMSISVLGSALGPKLFAIVEARTGSYDRAYFIGLGICALLFVSCFWLRNPQRPQKPTEL